MIDFIYVEEEIRDETKTKAVSGDRVIYTEERPAFLAKNRYGLDFEMPFDWNVIREAMISK